MAVNRYEFFTQRTISGGIGETIQLDRTPFDVSVAQYSGIYCLLNICISGNSNSKLAMETWQLAWRFSAANTISSDANDLLEVRLATMGSNIPSSVSAIVSSTNPAVLIVPATHTGTKLVLRGLVWVESSS